MSGMTRSMPNISSSGNISPQSITTISSRYSNTYMFLPISPTPPSGMIRSGWSLLFVVGCIGVLGLWLEEGQLRGGVVYRRGRRGRRAGIGGLGVRVSFGGDGGARLGFERRGWRRFRDRRGRRLDRRVAAPAGIDQRSRQEPDVVNERLLVRGLIQRERRVVHREGQRIPGSGGRVDGLRSPMRRADAFARTEARERVLHGGHHDGRIEH